MQKYEGVFAHYCKKFDYALDLSCNNINAKLSFVLSITSMQNYLLFCQLHQCKTISCSVNYINTKQFLVLSITSIQNYLLFCQLHQYKTRSCSVNYINTKLSLVNTKLSLVLSITSTGINLRCAFAPFAHKTTLGRRKNRRWRQFGASSFGAALWYFISAPRFFGRPLYRSRRLL